MFSSFIAIIILIILQFADNSVSIYTSSPEEVDFEKKIPSLSVVYGSDASMKCSVKNLADYQVSWIFVDKQTILSTQDVVRSPDPRIFVEMDKNVFTLIIKNVSLEDIGYYACRINCRPPKSQVGFLDVMVPPHFVNTSLDSDVILTPVEYSNVSLDCRAVANPPPVVTWKREDGHPLPPNSLSRELDKLLVTGEEMTLFEVSRWATGAYVCSVSNGISLLISRRITLQVVFPPTINIPSLVETSVVGQSVTLDCETESFPLGKQEWITPSGKSISSSSTKYSIREDKTYDFRISYRLTIRNVHHSDAGRYLCLIRSPLGVKQNGLTLYVVDSPKSTGTKTSQSITSHDVSTSRRDPHHQRRPDGVSNLSTNRTTYPTSPTRHRLSETMTKILPSTSKSSTSSLGLHSTLFGVFLIFLTSF